LSSQTVLGSWLHIDDAVVATSHPEEALQAVAVATEPPGSQAVLLGDTAENNPDSEIDNLEAGASGPSTPRTHIHYSDVD
jgi:hypothetical protein